MAAWTLPMSTRVPTMSNAFVLRAMTADGLPLYIGEHGPTIERANAIEFEARSRSD
jgi:hypothetical protein